MEALLTNVFYEVAGLLVVAAVGALTVVLRQPLIVAFIAVGIPAGPAGCPRPRAWRCRASPLASCSGGIRRAAASARKP